MSINADGSAPSEQVDGSGKPAPTAEERFHNQTQEFNRKLDNAVKPLQDKIDALLNKLSPPPKEEVEPDESLLYSDPKAYAKQIETKATNAAIRAVATVSESENAKNAVLGKLVTDFPELRDNSSPLAVAATAEYAQLPAHIKNAPEAYEIAVSRAALKQGTRPVSQRNDDFTLSGGAKPRANKAKDEEMDAVLQVAALFGKDVNDPEYVKTLKGHTQRDYSKYREPKPRKN